MLDLRRLRALRELADRGTIAAAADALHLTAPAVSQQLAALERDVGHSLMERDGRSVRLTPAADLLLKHADEVFAQLEHLQADLAAHQPGDLVEVRIGTFATAISGIAVPAAAALRESAPNVTLRVIEAEAPDGFLGLARRELDLVIAIESEGVPQIDDPRISRFELLADLLDVALPEHHPLAGEASVALSELAAEQWVAPPVGWSCDQILQAGCRAAGFSPRVAHRTADWGAALALVGADLGVLLVPRLAQAEPPEGVVLRRLSGQAPRRHIFAACRRGAEAAPAMAAVLDAVRAAAAAQATPVAA